MHRLRHLLLFGCLPVFAAAQTTLYWDANGATAGIGTAGGTWNTTITNWTSDALGNSTTDVWLNDGTARALFSPTSGSFNVEVGAGLQTRGLRFSYSNAAGSVITLTGGNTLTLTDPTIELAFNGHATIEAALASAVGLTMASSGNNQLSLNAPNPSLLGVTTLTGGILVFNHPVALGPGTAGNGIAIGDGRLLFDYVSGGDFSYTLDDAIAVTGTGGIGIEFESGSTRSATLTGAMTLTTDARFEGGPLYNYGQAQLIHTGVISGTSRNVRVEGEVQLAGSNTFTGQVKVAADGTSDEGRVIIPVFNDNGVAGPLGAGTGLLLGTNDGETGSIAEVVYTGATASSNRTVEILGEWGVIDVANSGSTLTLTGVISGFGLFDGNSLEKAGPGTLVLTGDNTFGGDTFLRNGTLVVGHNHALGPNGYYSTIEVGTYDTDSEDDLALLLKPGVNLGIYVDVYDDNYYGNTTLGMVGAGTATFSEEVYIQRDVDVRVDAGGTLNFTSFFSDGAGGGEIRKVGAGTAVFSGGLDIRGGSVYIDAGKMQLDGDVFVDGSVNVGNGAVLSGTAVIDTAGTVFVGNGGKLSPGNSPGTLTVDELYLASGSDLHWELGGLSTADIELFDRVVISAFGDDTEIYPDATLTIDLSLLAISLRPVNADPLLNDAFWRVDQTWTVIDFTNPDLGRLDNLKPGEFNPMTLNNAVWAGGSFSTLMGANGDLLLRFTPVPEPATWALGGLGGILLAVVARSRRRRP